jgi:hypothetical protein
MYTNNDAMLGSLNLFSGADAHSRGRSPKTSYPDRHASVFRANGRQPSGWVERARQRRLLREVIDLLCCPGITAVFLGWNDQTDLEVRFAGGDLMEVFAITLTATRDRWPTWGKYVFSSDVAVAAKPEQAAGLIADLDSLLVRLRESDGLAFVFCWRIGGEEVIHTMYHCVTEKDALDRIGEYLAERCWAEFCE